MGNKEKESNISDLIDCFLNAIHRQSLSLSFSLSLSLSNRARYFGWTHADGRVFDPHILCACVFELCKNVKSLVKAH